MLRFALGTVALVGLTSYAPAVEPKLTTEDAIYLDKLIGGVLFDPTGAERVTAVFSSDRMGGNIRAYSRDGWLVRGAGGNGNRVFFTDGDSEPAPQNMIGIDFLAACKRYYTTGPEPETRQEARERNEHCAGVNAESDLTLAAWLHKFGHDDLAADALASARKRAIGALRLGCGSDGSGARAALPVPLGVTVRRASVRLPLGWYVVGPRDQLCLEFAGDLYHGLLNAFANRQDDVAMECGTKLARLYRDVFRRNDPEGFRDAESILADLHRRKKAGTLGPDAPQLNPDNLPADLEARVAALIAALDEVTFTMKRPGGRNPFNEDWRVQALVQIGEPAVPALIDAFERDTRRTRSSAHPFVREPLLAAIDAILRVRVAGPLTAAELLGRPDGRDDKVKEAAAWLRAHWNAFGKLPFDERMMRLLTDPKSHGRLCVQAARHLIWLNDADNQCWLPELFKGRLAAKFSNPTVAEAILAARDRHLGAVARGDDESYGSRSELEQHDYLHFLVRFGDRRITPALVNRAGAETDLTLRIELAEVALRLGEPGPMNALAKAFEAGTLKLRGGAPADGWQGDRTEDTDDLGDLVRALAYAPLPDTDRALFALANPDHPYHQRTREALVRVAGGRGNSYAWRRHPFWLIVARSMLDDTTATGCVCTMSDGVLMFSTPNGAYGFNGRVPALGDPSELRYEAAERVCDRMAGMIAEAVLGLPQYHFLRLDSEDGFKAIKEAANKFDRRLRPLHPAEAFRLGIHMVHGYYVPDIKPLNRAATFADVATGDAVFHLAGEGKPAGVALPAWVMLKDSSRGLAVQAEIGPDGVTVYGVIFRNEMRAVSATEVEKIVLAKSK